MSDTEEAPAPPQNPKSDESPKSENPVPPVSDEFKDQSASLSAASPPSQTHDPSPQTPVVPNTPVSSQTHEPGSQEPVTQNTPAPSQTHEPGPQTPVPSQPREPGPQEPVTQNTPAPSQTHEPSSRTPVTQNTPAPSQTHEPSSRAPVTQNTPAPSQTHEPGSQAPVTQNTPAPSQTHEPAPQAPVTQITPTPRPGFANPNFVNQPSYGAPSPSFSYGPPVMRSQPPGPGQYLGNRPPFGYNNNNNININNNNMLPNPNASFSPGQQFQLNTGARFGLPNNASSLQPPVPMQLPRPIVNFPGPGPLHQSPAPVRVMPPSAHLMHAPGSLIPPPQPLWQRAPVQPNPVINQMGPAQNKEVNGGSKRAEETKENVLDIWTAHRTETGVIYYYNSLTGKSTYEKPADFKGEPEKVSTHSVPVSWEKIAGTEWALVTTNDGKKYYYDSKNKVSSWQVPAEVTEMLKKQESESKKETENKIENPSVPAGTPGVTPAVLIGGRDAIPLRPLVSPSALDTIKKKLQDTPDNNDINNNNINNINDNNKVEGEGMNVDKSKESESDSDSEAEETGPSKEDCINQFKEMLKERGVPPFAKWDKELPKIIFDPRFKAVPTNEARRAIFERYVRTRAEEERKEKKASQKAAIENFKQLLEEASQDIDHKTDYYVFKKKWGTDSRFKALDIKETKALLNEKVKAAEEKVQALRMATVSDFKSMFRENKEINSKSRWSKVKDNFRSDPRYKLVKHEERETLFNEYIAELKALENEAEQSAKSILNEQEKLKERERETRKRKEREEQEMERVKLKIRKKDAITSYQALLVETIKDPMASWKECKFKLEKDPQGRAINPDLPKEELEVLFREHVKQLYDRYARDFRRLLSEVINAESANRVNNEGRTILNSWAEFKGFIKSDPRFVKLPEDFKVIWRKYVDDWIQKNKHLLHEDKKEKLDGEVRRERVNERDNRREKEKERSERDYKRNANERSEREYKRDVVKGSERSEREYHMRDARERGREEREYHNRRDAKERERPDRDHKRRR